MNIIYNINTGLTDFDNNVGGISSGKLITIAGRPAIVRQLLQSL